MFFWHSSNVVEREGGHILLQQTGNFICPVFVKTHLKKKSFNLFILLFLLQNSVADPDPSDPYVFGPPGSGSVNQRYGSGSGFFYHEAKIVSKTLVLFCAVLWNRNRNRRNRNFLTSGTGTVTCLKVGTGTVINYGSGTWTRHKIMYLISFIKHFFSFTFYQKFVEIHELFPCKTAY